MRERTIFVTEEVTLSGKKDRIVTTLWKMRLNATEEAIFFLKRIFQVKRQSFMENGYELCLFCFRNFR